ncbi:cysteine-rich KTR domain-containing protein [Blautia producta]
MENYPLYCPKCRQERLIKVDNLKISSPGSRTGSSSKEN